MRCYREGCQHTVNVHLNGVEECWILGCPCAAFLSATDVRKERRRARYDRDRLAAGLTYTRPMRSPECEVEVGLAALGWVARCACGWNSLAHIERDQAYAAANAHVETVRYMRIHLDIWGLVYA